MDRGPELVLAGVGREGRASVGGPDGHGRLPGKTATISPWLGPDDVFVALVDYGTEVADQGLFEKQGLPRLAPSQFAPNRMQRPLPGMSTSQHFFSSGGRGFCLFTVIGSHARRMASVRRAATLVDGLRITDRETLLRQGGRP